MIDQQVLQRFPELFGVRTINGRSIGVEETITALTRELRPGIAAALTARRTILGSPAPAREKYAWPA
jgi:malate synthase